MTYIVDGNEYEESELENMEDGELAEIRLVAEKAYADQRIILGRGKLEFSNGGQGLSQPQFYRAKNIQNESEGLMKCIDLILLERDDD